MPKKSIHLDTFDKDTIFSKLLHNKSILQDFGVKKIGLFGSYVRSEQKSNSDIDFLVIFEEGKKNFHNFIGLAYYLEDLFGKKVEIVTEESLSPYIGPHIEEEVEYAII